MKYKILATVIAMASINANAQTANIIDIPDALIVSKKIQQPVSSQLQNLHKHTAPKSMEIVKSPVAEKNNYLSLGMVNPSGYEDKVSDSDKGIKFGAGTALDSGFELNGYAQTGEFKVSGSNVDTLQFGASVHKPFYDNESVKLSVGAGYEYFNLSGDASIENGGSYTTKSKFHTDALYAEIAADISINRALTAGAFARYNVMKDDERILMEDGPQKVFGENLIGAHITFMINESIGVSIKHQLGSTLQESTTLEGIFKF